MSQKKISDWIKSETEIKGICNEEELQFVPHRSSLGLSSGSRRFLMQGFVSELISPKTPEVGYYKACCPLPLKDCPSQWRLHNGTRLKPPLGYLTVPWNAVSGFSFGPRGELSFFLCPEIVIGSTCECSFKNVYLEQATQTECPWRIQSCARAID